MAPIRFLASCAAIVSVLILYMSHSRVIDDGDSPGLGILVRICSLNLFQCPGTLDTSGSSSSVSVLILSLASNTEETNHQPAPWNERPPIPSLCMTPLDRGLCRAKELRFFYNYSTGRCRPFSYSGCGGNENNFTSRRSCLRICKKGFNKKKGERRVIKIKKKRKKQLVKSLGEEVIPETIRL